MKEQIKQELLKILDNWFKEDERLIMNGNGSKGIDGSLTTDINKLSNQLLTLIEYKLKKKDE